MVSYVAVCFWLFHILPHSCAAGLLRWSVCNTDSTLASSFTYVDGMLYVFEATVVGVDASRDACVLGCTIGSAHIKWPHRPTRTLGHYSGHGNVDRYVLSNNAHSDPEL